MASKSNDCFLTMFQILQAHGFNPHEMNPEDRSEFTQQILADNAAEFGYAPECKVQGTFGVTPNKRTTTPVQELPVACVPPMVPSSQESPSGNFLLRKYKFILDKGREVTSSVTNEKTFTGSVDVDDKAFKQSARAITGEAVEVKVKIENPDWKRLKA